MNSPFPSVLTLAAVLAVAPAAAAARPAAEIHAQVRGAALEVLVNGRLAGSGWLATEAGFAFTASHVMPNRKSPVKIRLADGRLVTASVRARDVGHDALLLELADRDKLPAGLPLAAVPAAVGDEIYLLGSPIFRHGLFLTGRTAREGTAFEWLGEQREAVECIHVAASTPKGVSGGPWVNPLGEVVGVQSGLMEQGGAPAGIGWFGPAAALSRLLASKEDQPTSTLGVAFEELEEQSVDVIRGFPKDASGVILKVILKAGPAEAAGLPAGCLAVSIDGHQPTTRDAAYRLIRSLPPGKTITVRYFPPGKTRAERAEVVVGQWQEAP